MEIRRKKTLGFALLLFGLALCGVGLWLLLSPAQYQAKVKIRNEPDVIADSGPFGATVYDPYFYFIKSASESIQSEAVLTNVVVALNLNDMWGKKYARGDKLKTRRTAELLKRRIKVQTTPRTLNMVIRATNENSNEAALIANAIAEAFAKYRMEKRRQLMLDEIKVFDEGYRLEEQRIKVGSETVEQLRKKLSVPNPEPAEEQLKTNFPAYFYEKQKLNAGEDFYELLGKKIEQIKFDVNQPQHSSVEIIEV